MKLQMKRIISSLLCIVMLFTAMPVSADEMDSESISYEYTSGEENESLPDLSENSSLENQKNEEETETQEETPEEVQEETREETSEETSEETPEETQEEPSGETSEENCVQSPDEEGEAAEEAPEALPAPWEKIHFSDVSAGFNTEYVYDSESREYKLHLWNLNTHGSYCLTEGVENLLEDEFYEICLLILADEEVIETGYAYITAETLENREFTVELTDLYLNREFDGKVITETVRIYYQNPSNGDKVNITEECLHHENYINNRISVEIDFPERIVISDILVEVDPDKRETALDTYGNVLSDDMQDVEIAMFREEYQAELTVKLEGASSQITPEQISEVRDVLSDMVLYGNSPDNQTQFFTLTLSQDEINRAVSLWSTQRETDETSQSGIRVSGDTIVFPVRFMADMVREETFYIANYICGSYEPVSSAISVHFNKREQSFSYRYFGNDESEGTNVISPVYGQTMDFFLTGNLYGEVDDICVYDMEDEEWYPSLRYISYEKTDEKLCVSFTNYTEHSYQIIIHAKETERYKEKYDVITISSIEKARVEGTVCMEDSVIKKNRLFQVTTTVHGIGTGIEPYQDSVSYIQYYLIDRDGNENEFCQSNGWGNTNLTVSINPANGEVSYSQYICNGFVKYLLTCCEYRIGARVVFQESSPFATSEILYPQEGFVVENGEMQIADSNNGNMSLTMEYGKEVSLSLGAETAFSDEGIILGIRDTVSNGDISGQVEIVSVSCVNHCNSEGGEEIAATVIYDEMSHCFKAVSAGVNTITVELRDKEETEDNHGFVYARKTVAFTIETMPSSNAGYQLLYAENSEPAETLPYGNQEESWYQKEIIVVLDQTSDTGYTNIAYRKLPKQGEEAEPWQNDEKTAFRIRNANDHDYEFYFYSKHDDTLVSNYAGHYEYLRNVYVDTAPPDVQQAQIQVAQAYVSREEGADGTVTEYYDQEKVSMVLSGIVEDGIGISSVIYSYIDTFGEEIFGEIPVSNENLFFKEGDGTYAFTMDVNGNNVFREFTFAVKDYAGYQSTDIQYTSILCIDRQKPEFHVTAEYRDFSGEVHSYEGTEWTNRPVAYTISIDDTTLAKVTAAEYQFIPNNTIGKAIGWTDIPLTRAEGETSRLTGCIDFGADMVNMEQINESVALATEENPEEIVFKGEYATMNGTLFFRVKTNSIQTEEVCKEIRLWQQELPHPVVAVNRLWSGKNGWYNSQDQGLQIRVKKPIANRNSEPELEVHYLLEKSDNQSQWTTIEENVIGHQSVNGCVTGFDGEYYRYLVDMDGYYRLRVYVCDAAGNRTANYEYELKADFQAPTNVFATDSQDERFSLGTYEPVHYRFFEMDSVELEGKADFGISGEKLIVMKEFKSLSDLNVWMNSDFTEADNHKELSLPEPFRGFAAIYVEDQAGNHAVCWTNGFVIDSMAPEEITIEAPDANDNGFFNKDFDIDISVEEVPSGDNYSGLQRITYDITVDGEETEPVELYAFSFENPTWEEIVSAEAYLATVSMNASSLEGNEIVFTVHAIDNNNNEAIKSKVYMIDTTKPQIQLSYNHAFTEDNPYVADSMKVSVSVIERNFDPSLFRIDVKKNGVDYPVILENGWSDGKEQYEHVTSFVLTEDGDFTVTVTCEDLADNEADYEREDHFIIDKTAPEIEVHFDNYEVEKEIYYKDFRKASVTITETNFDENLVYIETSENVTIEGWTHNGNLHGFTINCMEDGAYRVAISAKDLAGNEALPFEEISFIIDTKLPEIEISGVEDRSANAGDVIPTVRILEENFDMVNTDISLFTSRGKKVSLQVDTNMIGKGYEFVLKNVNEQEDEVYTLTVDTRDLSGNISALTYRFSLNRNGSTYDLSDIKKVTQDVYFNVDKLEDLHIYEMNVDRIEQFTIYLSRNGTLLLNTFEGERPLNPDPETIYYSAERKGNDETGYEYHYQIYKENFMAEGIYNLTFYSKDRAGNEVNNTRSDKDAEIIFVVDNTAPVVTMSGAVAGEYFAGEQTAVNIMFSDNFILDEAYVYVIDETGRILETHDYAAESEAGEIYTIEVNSGGRNVAILYSAKDKAGNITEVLANPLSIVRELEPIETEPIVMIYPDIKTAKKKYRWLVPLLIALGLMLTGELIYSVVHKSKR